MSSMRNIGMQCFSFCEKWQSPTTITIISQQATINNFVSKTIPILKTNLRLDEPIRLTILWPTAAG